MTSRHEINMLKTLEFLLRKISSLFILKKDCQYGLSLTGRIFVIYLIDTLGSSKFLVAEYFFETDWML